MKTETTRFAVICDFAGVKNGRMSSSGERFGDANRAAMAYVARTSRRASVIALTGQRAELLVTYAAGPETGRPTVVEVGGEAL